MAKKTKRRTRAKARPKARGIRVSLKPRHERITELAEELEASAPTVWRVRSAAEAQALRRLKGAVEKTLTPLTKPEARQAFEQTFGSFLPLENAYLPLAHLIRRKIQSVLREETEALRATYDLPAEEAKARAWRKLMPKVLAVATETLRAHFEADIDSRDRAQADAALSCARSVAEKLISIDFTKEPSALSVRRAIGLLSPRTYRRQRG
jgi:hypothetical protein